MTHPPGLKPAPREYRTAAVGAELHGLCDGEGGRQGETLVDQFHPRRPRLADVASRHVAPADSQHPGDRLDDPGRDAGEGRLARAVLTDDGVDHVRGEGDADVEERGDLAVSDGNVPALERGGGKGFSSRRSDHGRLGIPMRATKVRALSKM